MRVHGMELRRLKRFVADRGGLCEAWLVYVEERDPGVSRSLGASNTRPRLVRAFWTRVEAAEWALMAQASSPGNRYGLYRIALDERWIVENSLRPAYYVQAVANGTEPDPDRPAVTVTAGAVAHVFG